VRENIPGDALASGTTLQWAPTSKSWQAGAVMQESDLNRRQTVRFGPEVAFAQVGIVGFDGQIELEALRLFGLPEAAPAILYGCPSLPAGGRSPRRTRSATGGRGRPAELPRSGRERRSRSPKNIYERINIA
jgi:hypothetical protein